ncbi:VCBS repeat-containing protein [Clostridium oceanicum]|uniref:VCBS repeat-containing protein n=1 Tax=Clostridium oceanicum TaxID=1543 RepID=A0ABP3V227_9CLOT
MFFRVPDEKVQKQTTYIIDSKMADVNGDKLLERVDLIGTKEKPEDIFIDNIRILITNPCTNLKTEIPLKFNAGYSPKLFLGDFNNDKVDDIFVSIFSGGSGGFGFYYVISFLNNIPKTIFDFEKFNQNSLFSGKYKDNYLVDIIDDMTNKKVTIDISYKDKEYLKDIYDENGKLIKPIEASISGLGELYPIDINNDSNYELLGSQRIIGRANADTLGTVQTRLKWNDSKDDFEKIFKEVSVSFN